MLYGITATYLRHSGAHPGLDLHCTDSCNIIPRVGHSRRARYSDTRDDTMEVWLESSSLGGRVALALAPIATAFGSPPAVRASPHQDRQNKLSR